MTDRRPSTTGRMPRARRLGIGAVALAVLVALTGCMPTFLDQAKPVSTPTGEDVAAELEPFYSQVLEWERCGDGLGCATATAPLDWDDPGKGEVELALVRHVATGSAPCS